MGYVYNLNIDIVCVIQMGIQEFNNHECMFLFKKEKKLINEFDGYVLKRQAYEILEIW